MSKNDNLRMVSILIAARNEEHTILRCLQSIDQLTYPRDQWEVWIGDDDSQDQTHTLIEGFICNKPNFHLLRITNTLGNARGKANVLAHLAQQAQGDYFLITDADVAVPSHWIQCMLAPCQGQVGVVTGITIPTYTNTWTALQAIDWVYALYIIEKLSHWQIPATAMGNNMLVTRASYEATGGYETIPFSITEDYQLFKEILDRQYTFRQVYSHEALALTLPISTVPAWLQQRKRWAHGALQTPWYIRLPLLAPLFFWIILLILAFSQPWLSLCLWLGSLLIQTIIAVAGIHRLRQQKLYWYSILFPLYFQFGTLATLIYYYLPVKTIWKGRVYE
ncbi:glycosyltransferase [Cytophagaceae bacterium YF14B1]|uniref:Glycosyltransferase n=1 Tax=Xanthocytophaga flava TaxID=3048013 RepID=A0AAE3QKZ7_9BACT|nr:glycosyltransferase [Xanthocytophaga flavus]MDJ1481287.1 glycosyltransferase [Xanthocytophaga flavus]